MDISLLQLAKPLLPLDGIEESEDKRGQIVLSVAASQLKNTLRSLVMLRRTLRSATRR